MSLVAHGVSVHVSGRRLIDDVSVTFGSGRFTAIVGPNGAGKSTLLRVLSGEVRPSAGRVTLDGTSLEGWPAWRLAAARAVLPQDSTLAFDFTLREAVGLGVDGIGRGLSRADRRGIVEKALCEAGLRDLAERHMSTLSGGERQRGHLARVLAQLKAGATLAPRQALLLDEPTASLDLRHQLDLLAAARALAERGMVVVAVLHELTLALRYADEIVLIADGRLEHRSTPATAVCAVAQAFGVSVNDLLGHNCNGDAASWCARPRVTAVGQVS